MKRHGTRPRLAMAALLMLMACNEQTPQDAASANMGGERRDDATPPGELPPGVASAGSAMPENGAPALPAPIDGRPPAFERAPPEIVPDATMDPPPG